MGGLWKTIKFGFTDLGERIKTNVFKFLGILISIIVGIFALYCSGSAFSTTAESLSGYLVVFGMVVCLIAVVLKLPAPPYKFKQMFQKENIRRFLSNNLGLIGIAIIEISLVVVMLITKEFGSIKMYIGAISAYMFAYLITVIFPFKKFVKWFSVLLPILTGVSLIFYFTINITNIDFSLWDFVNTNGAQYTSYVVYNSMVANINRNTSIFWEPGVFGSVLLLGLIIEISFREKIRPFAIILYIVGIITTLSTACYIALPFIIPLLIIRKCKKKGQIIGISIFVTLFVLAAVLFDPLVDFLAKQLPQVFGKLQNSSISFSTRSISLLVNFQIFIDNIFGAGLRGGGAIYNGYKEVILNLDAQTSTIGMWVSQLGIFGIIFIYFMFTAMLSKGIFHERLFIVAILLIVINKEPHFTNVLTIAFMFYLMTKEETYTQFAKHTSIKDKILGNEKTKNLIGNLSGSVIIKGVSLLVGFFATPAYIAYINNEVAYGVWFTLLSLLTWILTFDLGIGHGLKNKLIKAFAEKDDTKARKLVSTAYIVIGLVSLALFIVGNIVFSFVDFKDAFNIKGGVVTNETLVLIVRLAFATIVLEFWLKLILSVLHAVQKQAIASSLSLLTSIGMLAFLLLFKDGNLETKLITLSVTNLIAVNLPLLIATIVLFAKPLKKYFPSPKFFDKKLVKEILSLGGMFFIIQIALLIINLTNEILITQLFGPEFIQVYSCYYKPFHFIVTFAGLIASPLWAAVTRAYENHDFKWLKNVYKYINIFVIVLSVGSLLLFALLQPFFDIWLGAKSFGVNYFIAIVFALNTIITLSITLYASISNGIQALKSQIISHSIGAVLKIPLAMLLAWLFGLFLPPDIAWVSIICANVIVLSISPIWMVVESKKKLKMAEEQFSRGEIVKDNIPAIKE